MTSPLALAGLLFAAAAGAGRPPPPPRPASPAAASQANAPAGAPEDEALLRVLHEGYVKLLTERAAARKLLNRLNAERPDEKLAAAGKRGAGDAAARADSLRARLVESWRAYHQALGLRGVDPRNACRSQETQLREAARAQAGSDFAAKLPAAREDARKCLDRLRGTLGPLQEAAGPLREAVDQAEAFLGSARATPAPVPPAAGQRGR